MLPVSYYAAYSMRRKKERKCPVEKMCWKGNRLVNYYMTIYSVLVSYTRRRNFRPEVIHSDVLLP